MPMPISYAALGDARGFMDKCIESKKGGRLLFLTKDQAWHFRARCYSARRRELKNNAQIYPEGEVMHNSTVFHPLMFTIEELDRDGTKVWALSARHGDDAYQAVGLGYEDIE